MVLVTLVCCYFGLWETTKTQGVRNVVSQNVDWNGEAILPLIIGVDAWDPIRFSDGQAVGNFGSMRRRYYFWFFGYVAKLPYERDVPWQVPRRSFGPSTFTTRIRPTQD